MSYRMTEHAKQRAFERLNVPQKEAQAWASKRLVGKMPVAKLQGGATEYNVDGITFVVNEKDRKIITVYKTFDDELKFAAQKAVSRVLDKEHKIIRKVSREIFNKCAEIHAELSNELAKLARTSNPKAREKITSRVNELETRLDAIKGEQDALKHSYNIKVKQARKLLEL
ncbi:hypothetical protein ACRW9N_13230 [Listeria aquatica]|uniref:hypothetical protein n=1 Tax=Listeria aquatica TaxID=1494960 RepID=UPI003EF933D8